MEIEYKNKRIEKICTDAAAARAKYGEQMAAKIHMRVDNLRAATNVEMLLSSRIGGLGRIADVQQLYIAHTKAAMDLLNGMRLIFEKHGTTIQIAYIMEITDYH